MNLRRFKNFILFFGFSALVLPTVGLAQTLPATITINAGTTVTSFVPISIFGNNVSYWNGNTNVTATQSQVQAAGNYFLRYPGGSSSDDYHWNATGSFNSNGYWVPSGTSFTIGFSANETYRGTTSSYGTPSYLTDGSAATTWMSNVDTDFPNHQYAIVDLTKTGATTTVSAVTIVWGNPYATSFQVQYWTGGVWASPTSTSPESLWVATSAGTVVGTGGTQGVAFAAVATRYIRVLMTAASAPVTANLGSVTISGPAYAIAEVYVYNGGTQVSTNTNNSTNQSMGIVSSTDPSCSSPSTSNGWTEDFASFMSYVNSFSPHAIPLITVNFGTGTPQEAAAWVNYANKVQNYGIKYWQIGNETEGTWETGGPIPTQDYVRRYIEFYDAMKAVDPTIIITGPVAGGFNDGSNMYDGKGVVQDFVGLLATKGKIDHLNAIDYHWYPNYGNYTPAAALNSTSTLDAFPGQLNGWLTGAGVASPGTVPVIMSEYNVDPSSNNFQVQLGNGLWVADALGHFITDFGSRGFCNLWDVLNGGNDHTSATSGDLGYLDNTSPTYQPHASYWAMQMMTSDWAKPGDTASHQLISTSITGAPASLFAAYSDYRPDGVFSLVVVNKNPSSAYNTWITGLPFAPNASANEWTFNSTNYAWQTTTTPYNANPDMAPTTTTVSTGGASAFAMTFQPYSITVIQFTNSGAPTNTPTVSPTSTNTTSPTNTPTITNTPNYGPATLVDDFENLARLTGANPPNLWGGPWGTYSDSGSTIGVQYGVGPGAAGTSYAAKITGTMAAVNEYSGYASPLSAGGTTAFNLSGSGIVGLQFWIYGDGNTYRMMVDNKSVTDYDNYGMNITPPAGQWTFYQIPFSAMVTQGWGTQTGLPPTETGTDVVGVQFATQFGGKSYSVELDQIAFYTAAGIATATFTNTPTFTRTFTNTPTYTLTPTFSYTPTTTYTFTNTPTLTFTPTGTWFTSTPTNTSTSSFTSTPTDSPTATPTYSLTSTYTPTATSTSTFTPTPTSSFTLTPTFTATPANTLVLFPNPVTNGNPTGFYYNITSPVDQVRVKVFTLVFRKVFEADDLSIGLGNHLYQLDWNKAGLNLANGIYYVVVYTKSGGSETHQVMKLLVQR